MEIWKVYLAGSFGDNWREVVVNMVGDRPIDWLEPLVPKGQQAKGERDPRMFVPRDLALIKRSDYLVGWWRPESNNIGLSTEIGLAYAWNIPCVVAIPPESKVKARFPRGLVQEFDSLEELAKFLVYL